MKTETQQMLEEAKVKISSAKSVGDWNAIREGLRDEYPIEVISALDASGFVKTMAWAKPPTKKES